MRIGDERHRKAKALAAEEDITIEELVSRALAGYIKAEETRKALKPTVERIEEGKRKRGEESDG